MDEQVNGTPLEVPLMWTSRGNVPLASLRYEHKWRTEMSVNAHGQPQAILWLEERYFFEDGELASNSAKGFGPMIAAAPANSSDVTVGLIGAGIGGQQAAMQ